LKLKIVAYKVTDFQHRFTHALYTLISCTSGNLFHHVFSVIYINGSVVFVPDCHFSVAEPSGFTVHKNNYTVKFSWLQGWQLHPGGPGLKSQTLNMQFVICEAELGKGSSVASIY
jgi:hypothetical protein